MRELTVGGAFAAGVLVLLLIFVAAGWPGAPDPCIHDTSTGGSNTCWCEAFAVSEIGQPGVRQPFNTWSNLMALLYGAIVGLGVWWTRTHPSGLSANRMRSTAVYPLTYICVVIFLGLGSMWFHASITAFGGVVDQISMYAFANFILAYTIARVFPRHWPDWPVYVGYGLLTFLLTLLGATLHLDAVPISAALIAVVVLIYAVFEGYIGFGRPDLRSDWVGYVAFYIPAVVALGLAMLVWAMSQTGRPWCDPQAAFQLHGLWHWLAGITSVLLYFYWRHARG
jgi:hypothetical protein